MKLKVIQNVLYPPGSITPAGTVLDVPSEKAADFVKRGLAKAWNPGDEDAPKPAVSDEDPTEEIPVDEPTGDEDAPKPKKGKR